ncbi:MAG TPA: hypothetical protein DF383_09125 [Deltaproteobacteria bacterium]|nr:hypothetical protein [Deltaproteobacteria bacterium]
MDALAEKLKQDPHHFIQEIFYKTDLDFFRRHALQFMSEAQAADLLAQAENPSGGVRALFQAKSFSDFLAYLNETLEQGLKKGAAPSADQSKAFSRLLEPLRLLEDALEGKNLSTAAIGSRLQETSRNRTLDEEGYLRSDDQKMHVMLIRPADRKQDYKLAQKLVEWARTQTAPIHAAFPDISIGMTGGPVLNHDQFKISQRDMTWASLFAFVSTALIFIFAFKSFTRPFLGLLTLGISMTWIFGFVTVAIGHLNLFSLAFIVILIGQGTYYGVHVVARYEEELHRGRGVAQAIQETIANIFGNIILSAATTSAAFYATTLVQLHGFAELGWIAGTGVLVSAFAMIFLLPAFLILFDRNKDPKSLRGATDEPSRMKPWMLTARHLLQNHAGWIIAAVVGTAVWGGYMYFSPAHGIHFDNNLLNLQAKNTEAVRYEKKLIETSLSPRTGIFLTSSRDEAERWAEAAAKLPTVQRVEWLGSVFPESSVSETTQNRLRHALGALPVASLEVPQLPNLAAELTRLRNNLETIQNQALGAAQGEAILNIAEQGLAAVAAVEKRLPETATPARLEEFQSHFFAATRDPLIDAAQNEGKVSLPPELSSRFLAADGTYAVYVFPNVNIWDREPLGKFIAELRGVDPAVTGPPVMFFEIIRLVRQDYFRAAFYSACAIFLLFLLDFRSLRYALLASLPLILGVFSLFGFMSLFGLSFNTANMIALPMILGIGADNGVHIIHRFREEGARNINFLFHSTGKALLITYLDQMTSFVGLAFASHQGLAQLGKIVLLGLTSCTAVGIVLLPAIMTLLTKKVSKCRSVEVPKYRSV